MTVAFGLIALTVYHFIQNYFQKSDGIDNVGALVISIYNTTLDVLGNIFSFHGILAGVIVLCLWETFEDKNKEKK